MYLSISFVVNKFKLLNYSDVMLSCSLAKPGNLLLLVLIYYSLTYVLLLLEGTKDISSIKGNFDLNF